ncbi:MAG: glycosyltransferase family 4 protein [Elusimicrobia bacterium]|nr:glycosyltransferase family 4 protein [Elusimicrobiota bacterium]
MNAKNVAYLGHGLYFGGATASLFLLLKSLRDAPFEKHVFVTRCRSEEMKKDFLKFCRSVDLVRLPQIHYNQASQSTFPQYLLRRGFPCVSFARELSRRKIDILHVNTTVFPHLYFWVKRICRVKIVTHVRELLSVPGNGFIRRDVIGTIRKYSDAIVTISDNEAAPFEGHPGLAVMPNPFDFSSIDSMETGWRRERRIPEDCVLVAMMGKFHPSKGHLDFLQALKILLKEGACRQPFRFVMMGVDSAGDYHGEVRRFIEDNELQERLLILPYTYEIFEALKAMDVVVRPSPSGDPWGRDIIESMAFGKPVVATGTSEFYVRQNATGHLVPPRDPAALAAKIAELVNDRARREAFGRAGAERVRRMCDITAYGRRMEEIYSELERNHVNRM